MKLIEINQEIINIWKNHYMNSFPKTPIQYPKFKKNSILFIGMNPSDSDKGFNYSDNSKELFKLINSGNSSKVFLRQLIDHEKNALEEYPYFKPFEKISEELDNTPWDHVDMISFRDKNQTDIVKKLNKNILSNQLKILKKLILHINPKVIVVANAFASQTIKTQLNISTKVFDDEGFHLFEEKIPIFFSSMISYGRLDKGSYERLLWHIKKAIIWRKKYLIHNNKQLKKHKS